ncbi:MAG: hypothetical protein IJH12_06045 [Clostridia bacterium]|nr:hypothetical protein [Clostridia bacterium]
MMITIAEAQAKNGWGIVEHLTFGPMNTFKLKPVKYTEIKTSGDIVFKQEYVEEFLKGTTPNSYVYWIYTSPDESISSYLNKYIEVMIAANAYYIENESISILKQKISDYRFYITSMYKEFKETLEKEIGKQRAEILETNQITVDMTKKILEPNEGPKTIWVEPVVSPFPGMNPDMSQFSWLDPHVLKKNKDEKRRALFEKEAKDLHSSVREDGWRYDSSERKNIPLDKDTKKIDCSSYVCNVLYNLGYEDLKGPQKKCWDGTMAEWCNDNLDLAWEGCTCKVSDIENLEPGDIVLMGKQSQAGGTSCEHVQIFSGYDRKGNAVWLSCGSRRNDINLKEGEDIVNKTDEDRAILYVYHVK